MGPGEVEDTATALVHELVLERLGDRLLERPGLDAWVLARAVVRVADSMMYSHLLRGTEPEVGSAVAVTTLLLDAAVHRRPAAPVSDLLVERVVHRPGDDVVLLLDGLAADGPVHVEVSHLGDPVLEADVEPGPADARGRRRLALGRLDAASYAVRVRAPGLDLTTGLDVLADPRRRLRYGFVADFRPGRDDLDALADWLRAAHLTHVQLYDWMYRHARLLPPDGAPSRRTTTRWAGGCPSPPSAPSSTRCAPWAPAASPTPRSTARGRSTSSAHPEQVLRRRGGRRGRWPTSCG